MARPGLPSLITLGLLLVARCGLASPSLHEEELLRDELRESFPEIVHLSMGMSGDYELAVEEGATLVRLGTAIFGPRDG